VGTGVDIERPRRDSDNSLPPSAEVKNSGTILPLSRVSYTGDANLIRYTNPVPRTKLTIHTFYLTSRIRFALRLQ
jgi:hypothetical protein